MYKDLYKQVMIGSPKPSDVSVSKEILNLEPQTLVKFTYYRGLKNYRITYTIVGGFLIIIIVSWAPKPYSNY